MATAWKCEVCGFVHTGERPPFTCPICGAGREAFSSMKIASAPSKEKAVASWRCNICSYKHTGDQPPETCPVCGAERNLFEAEDKVTGKGAGSSDVEKVVIIGAGIAGITAAEQARINGPEVKISIISKEAGLPYFRLNLTRFLAGEVEKDSLRMQEKSWFKDQRIELIEDEVTSIDRENCTIDMRCNKPLSYDRLILANGSHAFIPPFPGVTMEGVLVFRTIEHVEAILKRDAPGVKVVCIGGGLLGLETAGALARRGLDVTIIEGDKALLPRQLSRPAADLLQNHIEGLGMKVFTDVRVKDIVGDESVKAVRFQSGDKIQAELVLITTGIRPNSCIARQAGLDVHNGIIVDNSMRTSDPKILACGDVAEHMGVLYGIWPASYAQGNIAGVNAVGGNISFPGIPPSSRLKVLDVNLFSIGLFNAPDASYDVFEEMKDSRYIRFVCRDGKMVGANLYGDTDLAVLVKDAVEKNLQIPELTSILNKTPSFAKFYGL